MSIASRLDLIEHKLDKLAAEVVRMPDETYDMKAAAAFVGLKMKTLYSYVSLGHIPAYKTGKKLYFSRAELEAWMRRRRRPDSIPKSRSILQSPVLEGSAG